MLHGNKIVQLGEEFLDDGPMLLLRDSVTENGRPIFYFLWDTRKNVSKTWRRMNTNGCNIDKVTKHLQESQIDNSFSSFR